MTPRVLSSPTGRRLALAGSSARPAQAPGPAAAALAAAAAESPGWSEHFRVTKPLRFTGGEAIDVPVTVVFGDRDRVALRRTSRSFGELPPHTVRRELEGCGHMVMWDRPKALVELVLDPSASSCGSAE